MDVYHFTSSEWALDDIKRRRIKIAEYHNCNDPFELSCYRGDKKQRHVLRMWKKTLQKKYGFVSFSLDWRNTLLWSHYADKHRGICLGFELQDGLARPCMYLKKRPPLPEVVNEDTVTMLLFAKPSGWEYEQEWRVSATVLERDSENKELCFHDFSDDFRLSCVLIGAGCPVTPDMVRHALGDYPHPVSILKARLGFQRFEVVLQQQGFRKAGVDYPTSIKKKYSTEVRTSAEEAGYDFLRERQRRTRKSSIQP
jgi:hypothetical protein